VLLNKTTHHSQMTYLQFNGILHHWVVLDETGVLKLLIRASTVRIRDGPPFKCLVETSSEVFFVFLKAQK